MTKARENRKHTEATADKQENAKEKVNARFSQTAASYRISRVHAQGPEFDRLLEAANFRGHEVIVDAGCGAGHTTAHIAPHVGQVIAVDLSDAMLHEAASVCAAQELTNVQFVRGDVETLDAVIHEHAPTGIDGIVSRFSAHHWPNPMHALVTFRKLLNRHGCVYLIDVVSQDDFVYDTHLQAIEVLRDPSHIRDHNVSQWQAMFEKAGFAAQSLYEWDLAIEFEDWIARMQTPPLETQAIRNLFSGAPAEVQHRFHLHPDNSNFTFSCALIRATAS